jgi:PAS domain S-box-containing protein/putative nucleotidyltransferase with HDIG domain
LRESETKHRTLVENLPQKVFFKDRNSVYISCNENYARDLKIKSEEITGKTDYDFYPKGLAKKYRQDDKRIIETGGIEQIEEKYIEDGRESWVQTVKAPVRDEKGNVIGLIGIFWDITERKQAEEDRKQSYQKLQQAMQNAIQAIALTAETRDPYTSGHQQRVTKLVCAIGEEIGLSKDKIEELHVAGILHDIGKMNVPAEILSKPGRLSEIEMSLIKTHPQVGRDILKKLELPWAICPIVLQHHERMDGSGYPSGLSGEDIMIEARILAVADVVEAMASHRPYRPALGIDKALEEVSQNKGVLYDPNVVDACVRLFTDKGFKFE